MKDLNLSDPQELQSPFDAIKQTDKDGKEWWNSRKLARVLGYQKYWNFERLIEKITLFLQKEKGLDLKEHILEIEEMAQLGLGTVRQVSSVMLSRTACLAIVMNADQRKPLVKVAKEYFAGKLTSEELAVSTEGNVLMYRSSTGKVNVTVVFNNETFWLSQKRMSELFNVSVSTISYHLSEIDKSGEVHLSDAIRKIRIPSDKWGEDTVLMYNLDAVIAVGYRVNSYEATQFRRWATEVLKQYIVKGFVMDDERLKGKDVFGADYFEELLERIREIRTSERRYYQKITDIYAECSYDYDSQAETTRMFYQTVQNMMHYAVTHQTAAEIIYDRANAEKPYMGLMAWKNAPDGRVVKSDVTIAKNYLSEKEVESLNRLTSAFLDMAEDRAQRKILMKMTDWKQLLEKYLKIGDYEILKDSGNVSHEEAEAKAVGEYEKFRRIQDRTFMSDFDKQIEGLLGKD
ncbi:MAG: virulence RhuM family protein [Bacteroidales bacterium]|nr:virulence RhuM family protein [Bacteroidales bacterium]